MSYTSRQIATFEIGPCATSIEGHRISVFGTAQCPSREFNAARGHCDLSRFRSCLLPGSISTFRLCEAFGSISTLLLDHQSRILLPFRSDPTRPFAEREWLVKPTEEGQTIVQNMKSQISTHLWPPLATSSTGKDLLSSLPLEILSMILSNLVVEETPIPLKNARLNVRLPGHQHHSKRCCGHCRGDDFTVQNDEECRCTGLLSYSTSCRCVSLSEGIFFVSKSIRDEAL